MKVVNTELGRFFNLPNPGLNSFLDRTLSGQPDDYRTPFWGKADRKEVLDRWLKVVDQARLDQRMLGLYDIEMEQMGKVGPLSIMMPFEKRKKDVDAYYTLSQKVVQPVDRRAVVKMKSTLRKGSLIPSTLANTLEDMKLSTNSGAPYFTKRRAVKEKTVNEILTGKWRDHCVAVLGWRGQAGGPTDEDVKQRVVWMMPFALNILELQIYQPLIKAWQTDKRYPALISLREVEMQVSKLFDSKDPSDLVVATDFSKFDQHINPTLQMLALELLMYQFRRGDSTFDYFTDKVFHQKYTLPLVCTGDVTYFGDHGMGSGSGGTNSDENLIHGTLQHEAAILNGVELNPYSTCLGDDGILSFKGITADKVVKVYTQHGLDMNPDKQYSNTDSTVYLQRYYHRSYRDTQNVMLGVYSTFRALGRLMGQERFYDPEKWNNKLVTLRAWSIIENCSNHPLFESFVDFVLEGDKFRLGLEIPGFFDGLDKIVEDSREAIPDLMGYAQGMEYEDKPLGIRSWRVYRYLNGKRDRKSLIPIGTSLKAKQE